VGPHYAGANRVYSPVYVHRLKDMLQRHTVLDLDFVCFTNVSKDEFRSDIRVIPLEKDWPVWWAKLESFRPGLDLADRVMSLDLDMLIVGDMDSMINYPHPVALCDFWSYSAFHSTAQAMARLRAKRNCTLIPVYSSDVLVYDRGACDCLYMEFTPDAMLEYCGDQDWIAAVMGTELPKFPRRWARKLHKRDMGSSPIAAGQARTLACHPIKNHQLALSGYTYADRIWRGVV